MDYLLNLNEKSMFASTETIFSMKMPQLMGWVLSKLFYSLGPEVTFGMVYPYCSPINAGIEFIYCPAGLK